MLKAGDGAYANTVLGTYDYRMKISLCGFKCYLRTYRNAPGTVASATIKAMSEWTWLQGASPLMCRDIKVINHGAKHL